MNTPVSPMRKRVLALAVIFQASALADALAWKGQADSDSRRALLESLQAFEAQDPLLVFTDIRKLELGLKTLEECLVSSGANRGDNRQADRLRYALGLIQLERKLSGNKSLMDLLQRRLRHIQAQVPHFEDGILSLGISRNLAAIYVDTLGTLPRRILIRGNEQRLTAAGLPEQIRAVLLAGAVAAGHWHRLGGRRWHLLFQRGRILDEIRALIREQRSASVA